MKITKPMWAEIIKMIPIVLIVIAAICCFIFIPALHTAGIVLAWIVGACLAVFVCMVCFIIAKDGWENLIQMWNDEQERVEREERAARERRERERREMQRRTTVPDEHFRLD